MSPYKKNTIELRTRAMVLMEMWVSCPEVSRQLNVNVKTIYDIKTCLGETGWVADRPRSGRPKKTSVRQDRALVRYSLSYRHLTSPELRQRMESELGVRAPKKAIYFKRRIRQKSRLQMMKFACPPAASSAESAVVTFERRLQA